MFSISSHSIALQASHTPHLAVAASLPAWRRAIVALVLLSVLLLALFAVYGFGFAPTLPFSPVSSATAHTISSQVALMRSPNSGCGAVSLPC